MSYTSIRRFYNTNVTLNHNTGDVWSNLPTHGLLKISHVPGVIITPACDLANEKADTLTYLPVLSISQWLSTRAFYPEVRRQFTNLLDSLKLQNLRECLPSGVLPENDGINILRRAFESVLDDKKLEASSRRCLNGILHLEKIVSSNDESANISELEHFFGKNNFKELIYKVIRNSFSNEIHFIPADEQNKMWSIINDPSLVLFRYPLTAPLEVFEYAQRARPDDWENEIGKLALKVPFISNFGAERPLKGLQINEQFLHDMLVRFVNLFSRLGSPDFTSDSISRVYLSLGGSSE
ncbi:MAG TPA: hypothetical protein VGC76_01655 [Pyrinomonadaceae bacterium]|jgi:hypothetical protein